MPDTELSNDAQAWVAARLDDSSRASGPSSAHFKSRILEVPEMVTVTLAAYRAPHVGLTPGEHRVWLVVKDDPQSVFYDCATQKFGACWGPDRDTGELIDLGFRSHDPLEMYTA